MNSYIKIHCFEPLRERAEAGVGAEVADSALSRETAGGWFGGSEWSVEVDEREEDSESEGNVRRGAVLVSVVGTACAGEEVVRRCSDFEASVDVAIGSVTAG